MGFGGFGDWGIWDGDLDWVSGEVELWGSGDYSGTWGMEDLVILGLREFENWDIGGLGDVGMGGWGDGGMVVIDILL